MHLTQIELAAPANGVERSGGSPEQLLDRSVQRKLFPAGAVINMAKGKSQLQACMTS